MGVTVSVLLVYLTLTLSNQIYSRAYNIPMRLCFNFRNQLSILQIIKISKAPNQKVYKVLTSHLIKLVADSFEENSYLKHASRFFNQIRVGTSN